MSISLSQTLFDTSTPPISEAYDWAAAYTGAGGPLINMAQAAPSTPPDARLLAKFGEAAADPEGARYGSIYGDMPLREAYAAELSRIYGGPFEAEEVGITSGCNMAFFTVALSLAMASEAILIPAPWYFNHQMSLTLLGIEPRVLPTAAANGFVPDVATAEALIDSKVKAILLVTPNNPTGAVYPPATVAAFADLCRRKGIWLILDETYRDFLPEGRDRPHEAFADPAARANIIQLYSFSKAFAMPGHRLGAIMAPKPAIAEMAKAFDTIQICPPRPGQTAVTWALTGLDAWRAGNRVEINRRGAAFRAAMAKTNVQSNHEKWEVASVGAYFAYLRHPFQGVPSWKVARELAMTRGVLALPGSYFGPAQDDHMRFAFANVGVETIAELPERLAGFSVV